MIGFDGPSPELMARINKAYQAPALMDLSPEDFDALQARLIEAREFDDLDPADQELLVLGETQVSAGLSPTWQHPDSWGGDWAAEDELLDAADEEADPDETPAADAAGGAEPEVKRARTAELLAADDPGWVGL